MYLVFESGLQSNCTLAHLTGNEVGLLPVQHSGDLKNSLFGESNLREKIKVEVRQLKKVILLCPEHITGICQA